MRKKKRTHLEYRLFILPSFTHVTKTPVILIRIETMKEFANFAYEIALTEKVIGNSITWRIQGLRSPEISLPASGPATFAKKYENLQGVYEFVVTKLDGEENAFTINIAGQNVSVIKSPRQKFVEVFTSAGALTAANETS